MKGKSQKPAKLGMVTLSISEAREADDATAGLCADYSGFLRDDGTYQPASNEERDKAKIPQGRKGWTPAPDYALHLARKIDSGAIGRCLKNAADSRHEFMPAAWRCGIEGCVRCDVPIPPLKLTPSGKMRYEKFAGKGSGMGEVAAAQAKPSAGQPASTKPIERTDATAPSSAPVVRVEEYGKYGCGVGETHGGIDSQQQSRPGNSEPGKQECSLPPVPFSEAEAKKRYLEAIDRGLSDAEAREEGWPTAPSPVPVAGAKGEPEYFIAVVNGGPHSGQEYVVERIAKDRGHGFFADGATCTWDQETDCPKRQVLKHIAVLWLRAHGHAKVADELERKQSCGGDVCRAWRIPERGWDGRYVFIGSKMYYSDSTDTIKWHVTSDSEQVVVDKYGVFELPAPEALALLAELKGSGVMNRST